MNFALNLGGSNHMLIVKNKKAYASQFISKNKIFIQCSWQEASDLEEDIYFAIPRQLIELKDKDSLEEEDIAVKVKLDNEARYIRPREKSNSFALINREEKIIFFLARKDIKIGEEITYVLDITAFENVKIQ